MKWMYSLFFGIIICSCNHISTVDMVKEKEAMKQADISFSALSEQKGMKAAFLHYIDSDAVLLRPDYYPIIGKEAVYYLQKINDSSFSLTWKPQNAEISSSGDLGYTYGIYTLHDKDTTMQGTYITLWRKHTDASWKFVLDTGNPGVGKK